MSRLDHDRRLELPPGLIFDIARSAGIEVPDRGAKRPIRCSIHDDRTASAFLSELNIFYCSVCTPDGGWSAKEFAAAVGVPWQGGGVTAALAPRPKPIATAPAFTKHDAQLVWSLALARARNDDCAGADREVYDYLSKRGVLEAWELSTFGVLAEGMPVPESIGWWARASYRIVAPLYDQRGELVSVQARAITRREPKTLFPKGSRANGASFASKRALELLASGVPEHDIVVLGEGLTDFLALVAATPIPVLCAPGTGFVTSSIGPWVHGRTLLLALDNDAAGDAALGPAAEAAYAAGARRVVKVRWPSGCKDACDVVAQRELAGLEAFLAVHMEARRG
ncbi:MAG: toprim domain-containing protein [Planctomycetes bacterium]|nr:toprim domain-containing protein [Planctomycetota bacterium]